MQTQSQPKLVKSQIFRLLVKDIKEVENSDTITVCCENDNTKIHIDIYSKLMDIIKDETLIVQFSNVLDEKNYSTFEYVMKGIVYKETKLTATQKIHKASFGGLQMTFTSSDKNTTKILGLDKNVYIYVSVE